MVKKDSHADNPQQWVAHFARLRDEKDVALVQSAIDVYGINDALLLSKGLGITDILLSLGLDTETLASTLVYPAFQAHLVHTDFFAEKFGEACVKLLHDVLQMQSLGQLQHLERSGHQMENLRKMLLAMVTDVRAVLIVLAERLWQLRQAKHISQEEQQKLAQETLDVYAPLANRLGIWQLKWETEDLCLRYLQPDTYKEIAHWLASRRQEREEYVQRMIEILTNMLEQSQIKNFQVTGRVKHIYSIYRKMRRKEATIDEIYDISALRVLVNTIEDCYTVLGFLQETWQQIPKEFDDYVATPKQNGYRSIHTVIIGPEERNVEVQIRTYQMHHESELGVAAHWRYKEGVLQTSNYEAKIALLRQVMAWQKEIVQDEVITKQPQDLFADRVYVFTPTGDIVDLAKGATPLDFAYHIHSEVGHRCRGAKIDGNIVPLTYQLQTGERVEILTAKQPNPSRDWLNIHLGYLKTSRARAKVMHYFKLKDSAQNTIDGRELLSKELRRLGIHEKVDLNAIAHKLNYKTDDDLLAGLAAGDIRMAQIIHHLQPVVTQTTPVLPITPRVGEQEPKSAIQILGINNLLTNIARCCKPLPGDDVIGYITINRGVSIHRRDCRNALHAVNTNQSRLIEVEWGKKLTATHSVDLKLRIYDRSGLLRDITTVLAGEKINVLGLQTQKDVGLSEADIYLSIEIENVKQMQKAIDMLKKIPNVIEVKRR